MKISVQRTEVQGVCMSFLNIQHLSSCLIKYKSRIYFLLLSLLFSFSCFTVVIAQNGGRNGGRGTNGKQLIPVTGMVTTARNQPVAGATITQKGTKISTLTDAYGNYRLNVDDEKAVLVVSYVGYSTQEVPVNSRSSVSIVLGESNSQLNDVVVVGYGTQKKASVTGAISSVKGTELAQAPVDNITNSIAGRVTGVVARQTGGGQPGNDNTTFSIRGINTTGNNAPLIVIDGIIRNNINQIDPNAIESVTILKDAAAVAPYGLGGANGVVLITTKSGRAGAPTLSASSYYGMQTPTYYPKVLSAVDYLNLQREAAINDRQTPARTPEFIASYVDSNARNPDKFPISRARDVIDFSAPIQSHNIEISGGSDRVKYYTSLGYFDQDGLFARVNYKRFSYTMALDANVTSSTKVILSLKGSYEIRSDVDPGASTNVLFRDTYKLIPTDPLQFTNGLAGSSAGLSLVGALRAEGYNRTYTNTVLSTIGIEQQLPLKGLSIKGTVSYDPNQANNKQWHTPFYYYNLSGNAAPYTFTRASSSAEGVPTYAYLSQTFTKNETFTYDGYLNYHSTFGKHEVTGLFVAEARNSKASNFNSRINNYSFFVDEFSVGSSNRNDYTIGGGSSTASQVGYVYRVGDNFANKYIIEASGRYDGHYYFAPGRQYAFFPAFSAGWIISQENFMKNIHSLNYLKIRGSWGKSGALAGSAFQFLNLYNLGANASAFGNGTLVQGTAASAQANPFITWEQSVKTDIGFDANLYNGLLSLSVDVYKQKRTGMLVTPQVVVPTEYGIALSQVNGGAMEGQGVEVALGSQHKFSNGLYLGINGTFTYNTNKLTQVFETASTYNNPNRRRTGRPFNTPFGYHSLGLFQKEDDKNGDGVINATDGYPVTQFGTIRPGDIRYEDISGPGGKPDGKIDANDQVPIGNNNYPLIYYGINLTAAWKGFDLSLFFAGTAKSTMGTQTFLTVPFTSNNSNAGYQYYNDHWSPTNPGGHYPIADQAPTSNNTQPSDFWQTSGAYMRLKTAQLGYTIPVKAMKMIHLKTIRFYLSGQNLFTVSKLKFIDPELGNPVTGTSAVGTAGSGPETIYPISRVITGGLNITF